jgi:ABC-type sulfate transport system permease component
MPPEAAGDIPTRHGASGNRRLVSAMLGPVALVFLSAPFVTLAFVTDWQTFHFAPGDWGAVRVSLGYGLVSLPIIVCLGTPLAWWLARCDFRGTWVVAGTLRFSRQVGGGCAVAAASAHPAAGDGYPAYLALWAI